MNELNVTKKVFKPGLEIDLIEKCLWILCEKGNFATMTKVKVDHFKSLRQSLTVLLEMNFPMLISIESKLAAYHHVVVVWKEMVIDYESMLTYPSIEDSLRQICGVNTTFIGIRSGYGIFPSTQISKLLENANIIDWGSREYYKPKSAVREYFYLGNKSRIYVSSTSVILEYILSLKYFPNFFSGKVQNNLVKFSPEDL